MPANFLNNFFGFNKQQRNGLLVLASVSFILLLIRMFYPYFIKPDRLVIKDLPLIERKIDSAYTQTQNKYRNNFSETNQAGNLCVFDPNTVSFDQLMQLGFKEKTAKIFLKFRDRGFVFKQKADLQKVYGISDNFYEKLQPYILIESKSGAQQKSAFVEEKTIEANKKVSEKQVIELNTADSIALVGLNGIGPSFAKRILKYKNILGGFVAVEQLKEVYGFNEELFEKVKDLVTIEASLIKKIDLNKDDFKTINKHPYLSYELTKAIFDQRRKTPITAANLKEIINEGSVYNKLLPYLLF